MKREVLEKELKAIGEDDMQNAMTKDVLEVYDVIAKQGHSGFSFGYFAGLVRQLIFDDGLVRPIRKISEDESDWALVEEGGLYGKGEDYKLYQNVRRPSVFCRVEDGKEVYNDNDKVIVTEDGGEVWFHAGRFRNFETIKMPYYPDGKKWHIYTEPTVELEPGYGPKEGEYVITKIEYR